MSDKLALSFVDTNVLVYAYDTSAGDRRESAMRLVGELGESRSGCLSLQILQEFFVTVTTRIPNRLSRTDARRLVSDFATWPLHEPSAADVLGAIDIHDDLRISFWDAMVVRSAAQMGCAKLWSEDLNDGQTYQGVKVTNPF